MRKMFNIYQSQVWNCKMLLTYDISVNLSVSDMDSKHSTVNTLLNTSSPLKKNRTNSLLLGNWACVKRTVKQACVRVVVVVMVGVYS